MRNIDSTEQSGGNRLSVDFVVVLAGKQQSTITAVLQEQTHSFY